MTLNRPGNRDAPWSVHGTGKESPRKVPELITNQEASNCDIAGHRDPQKGRRSNPLRVTIMMKLARHKGYLRFSKEKEDNLNGKSDP